MKTMVLFTAIAAAGIAGAEDLPLVYEQDFESGMGDWIFTDEKAWALNETDGNKALALIGPSNYEPKVRSPLSIARIKDLALADFVLEADMKQTGREYGHRDLCIFFGYQGPEYFYYVHIATEADPNANSIFLVNNAPRVSIAQERNDGNDWGKDYNKVRVTRNAESGLIEVFFRDMQKPIMRTVDKTFEAGGIGFGSFDDTGMIDNIKIWGKKVSAEGSDTKK